MLPAFRTNSLLLSRKSVTFLVVLHTEDELGISLGQPADKEIWIYLRASNTEGLWVMSRISR